MSATEKTEKPKPEAKAKTVRLTYTGPLGDGVELAGRVFLPGEPQEVPVAVAESVENQSSIWTKE